MLENRFRWLVVALAAFSMTAAGCTEDDASSDGGPDREEDGGDRPRADTGGNPTLDVGIEEDAGGGGDDTGGSTIDPDEVCGNIPVGENIGDDCSAATDATFCGGDGGQCVTVAEGEAPTCAQTCYPDLCGDTCTGGTSCVGLVNPANNEPTQVDVDGDGSPDTDLGACAVLPTGDTESYAVCDADNLCQSGNSCLITAAGSESGHCFPDCVDGECSDGGVCVLGTQGEPDPTNCLPTCTDTAESSDCPAEFTCTAVQGGSVCVLPGMVQ
jgi:hypothetical protein